MLRTCPVLIACVAVIACGIVHGFWTDRWQKPVETAAAAARLEQVPTEVGEWVGERIDLGSRSIGEVDGCVQFHYTKRGTSGPFVGIALVCGRPGPVSIHTPQACYTANGYEVGDPRRAKAPDGRGEFWTADAIKKKVAEETRLRLYWGWYAGQGWTAPEDARLNYTGHCQVLHKLYVWRELGGANEPPPDEDPCLEFMKAFLPALEKTLFAPDQ
jgi:hypothetical protein